MGKVTIEEVAARAGVSGATVSKAVRGLPVSDETRERVFAAAFELGWAPNPHAASLASGRTATIGLAMAFYGIWYDVELLNALDRATRRSGFDLLVWPTESLESDHRSEPAIRSFARRVDGLIVADFCIPSGDTDSLGNLHVPAISVGGRIPGLASVEIDNRAAARMAVTRLVELGHRRIALITEAPPPVGQAPVAAERREGYREALVAGDIDPDLDLELVSSGGPAGGAAVLDRLMALRPSATAAFCNNDEIAVGLAVAAQKTGVRLPEDLSMIGFDDTAMAEVMDISSVRQPIRVIAERAVDHLVSAIRADRDFELHEILGVELIERGSIAQLHP